MMNYIAPSIVGYIGFDLTVKCLSSITSSATNICSVLSFINSHTEHADIIFEIQTLDLDTDIEGATFLLLELKPRLTSTNHTQTLAYSVKKLSSVISQIETLLITIHEKLAYNKSLIVAPAMRAHKLDKDVLQLKSLKNIFKERRTTLFEVIKINPYLRPYDGSEETKETCLNDSMIVL